MAGVTVGKAILAPLLCVASCSVAAASERGEWFHSLHMPGTNALCCDEGDCHRTDADWRAGHWWALVNDEWREVPRSKVLSQPLSIDGSAYICSGSPAWTVGGDPHPSAAIYCFVPPNWPS
jgi:hypothetical protein